MSVTAYPLCWPTGWPRVQRRKVPNASERCAFPWARTKLSTEVDRLGASDAILSSNCVLNLAGEPRGDRQPADSGVALYFALKGRPMVMATDHFSEVSSNLRRLALAVTAGGYAVLVEVKHRDALRLTYSDIEAHQRAALDAFVRLGALALLVWANGADIAVMRWADVRGMLHQRGDSLPWAIAEDQPGLGATDFAIGTAFARAET